MIETKADGAYQLGAWAGRKQAFAEVAGRCSAADAECMRQARESKHYRTLGMNWEEFCKQRMGMSRASADRIIGLLQEFGPQYFVLAQATGINAVEYRRISGAVRGQALLHAGEEIPIQAENAPRLAAAVEELRRGQKAGHKDATEQAGTKGEDLNRTLDKLERTLTAVVSEAGRVHGLRLDVAQIERLQNIVLEQMRRMPMVQVMRIVVRP